MKNWYTSQTLIGITGMVIVMVLKSFKWDVDDSSIQNWVTLAFGLISATVAIIGRIRATKRLK
jgi:hypothetical protein